MRGNVTAPGMAHRNHVVIEVTMSFFIAALLAAYAFVLHLAGEGQAFTGVCQYSFELCRHPTWPLYVAAAFVAFGMLFRLDRV